VFLWLLGPAEDPVAAGWLLGAIGATDWVDGYLARRLGQVSELGKLLRESSKFVDWDVHAPWSNSLYKAVVDATIVDPRT